MADTLEHELVHDLQTLADRFGDESFARDTYRALTNRRWRKPGGPEGHVSFSWGRAEEIVNGLRAERDRPALELAQTGGEGEVERAIGEELDRLGWTSSEQDTGCRDAAHVERDEQAPPPDQGSRQSPNPDPHAAERLADAEADREQERTEA